MEMGRKSSLIERMLGAATLNIDTYEEVEHDESATSQAAMVVAIVAVAAAIGGAGSGGWIPGLISAFAGWLIWSGVTYLIGTALFEGKATWGELLRTLGFAQSPGVLYVLGIVPFLGGLVRFAVWIWLLVAGIIAIRQALDVDTGKAILTALIGWGVYVVFAIIVAVFVGGATAILG